METDNIEAPSSAQKPGAGVALNPDDQDAGVELRIAMSVREGWRARVDAVIMPLEVLRRQLQDFGSGDSDTLKELVDKLQESVRCRLGEHADDTLTPEFVLESCTEVATIVANGIPNDVAATRDLDGLQRSIREATAGFVHVAREELFDERLLDVGRPTKDRAKVDSKRKREIRSALQRAQSWRVARGGRRRTAVKFAKAEIRQLINRLRQIAGDVETVLIAHAVMAVRHTD